MLVEYTCQITNTNIVKDNEKLALREFLCISFMTLNEFLCISFMTLYLRYKL